MRSERFVCPSFGLSLSALRSRTRQVGYVALAAAVAHLCAAQIKGAAQEQKTAKPLTTQFVKRQPRLTKPLELKKRPRPKRRTVQREMVAVKARTARDQAVRGLRPAEALRGLARPHVELARGQGFVVAASEPQAVAALVEGDKEPASRLDMSLEMMDIEDMDTGRFQALVIQDPSDKRHVRGFLHLAYAYSVRIRDRDRADEESRMLLGLHRLVAAINQYTRIKADFQGRITFDNNELFKVPWAFVGSHTTFRLTESEAGNLGRYLQSGGFVLAEDWWPGLNKLWTPGYTGLHQMLVDALARVQLSFGRDWTFEQISGDHPICHCYFDFGAPPLCRGFYGTEANYPVDGITVNGRLYGILSRRAYSGSWANDGPGGAYGDRDPTRNFQFGVNMIVYTLTQEGSITKRLMGGMQ